MNTASKLVSFVLISVACGPPGVQVESSTNAASTESGDPPSTGESSTGESSSSESTTTESDTTESTLDDEVGFVPMGDTWDGEGGWPCEPFQQDCAEGEKCVPYGSTGGLWDANKCVIVEGDQAPGEPCIYGGTIEATDDCDASGICWNVLDGDVVGTCHAFCTGSEDDPQCPPNSQCLDDLINVCVTNCDPLLQDCGEGLGCYFANLGFSCVFTMGGVPTGEPCGYINDCAEGHACLDMELLPMCMGSACCGLFCDVGLGDAGCAAVPGTSCVPFFEIAGPPGFDDVGVCILPP